MPSLHTINIILLIVYLPVGFMGWAFAAGASAQTGKRGMFWFAQLFFLPLIVLLGAIFADSLASGDVAHHLERAPLYALGGLVALVFAGAIVSGFVQGIRESRKR